MKTQKSIRARKAITINRVSTQEQAADHKSSLPAQIRDNRQYCQDKKLEIIAEYSFDESAFKDKRKKFGKVRKRVEESEECIAIVADRVDRFQRSFRESVEFEKFRKTGEIELHFVGQGLILHRNSTANELITWHMHALMAESYVLMLSDNVKKGIKEKLAKGQYPGYVPTGLKNVTVDIGDNIFVKKIELDSERSHFIKKIFQLYATGKYSLSQVAEIVNNAGFTIKKKRVRNISDKLEKTNAHRATKTDILTILKNPIYYGEFLWRDPETGERRLYDSKGSYPTLIEKSLFKQAQIVINSNNSRKGGYKKNTFKFRGLLKCQFCGLTMTAEEMSRSYKNKSAKNVNTVYYHCSSGKALIDPGFYENKYGTDHSGVRIAKKGKQKGETIIGCPQRWWKEDEIEKIILEEFDMMHYDDSVFEGLKRLLRADYEERINMADSQIKGLEAEYKKNEKLIKSFTLKFATITDKRLEQDMMETYDQLKAKQDELKEEIRIFEEAFNANLN